MNPLFSLFTGGGNPANSIMLQALGAAMRGESPQSFLQTLAQTNPQLKGIDFGNLEGTARQIAAQQGKDLNAVAGDVRAMVNKLM